MTFFGSIAIGTLLAMFTSLMFKHINFRKYPSLEFALLLIACYSTYLIGEGLKLSGILAILSNGIVNSHYTHFNLSHSSQTATHLMFKTMAYISETIVFAYLGLAVFSFRHEFDVWLVIFSMFLCLLGRAMNIFPLSYILNKLFRTTLISKKTQFTMFFSGLRGAIAFSLSLTTTRDDYHNKIATTTLFLVLFTTIIFGGGTYPLLKYLYTDINIGEVGTEEEIIAEEDDTQTAGTSPLSLDRLSLFARMDEVYFRPFFRIHSSHIYDQTRLQSDDELDSTDRSENDETEDMSIAETKSWKESAVEIQVDKE